MKEHALPAQLLCSAAQQQLGVAQRCCCLPLIHARNAVVLLACICTVIDFANETLSPEHREECFTASL